MLSIPRASTMRSGRAIALVIGGVHTQFEVDVDDVPAESSSKGDEPS
jgi:hypothetical protein